MNEIDKAALALATESVRKESPSQCQRIDDRLAADEDWTDIGKSCAYHRQIVVLDLMPWQSPPCYADLVALREPFGDPRAAREGAELRQRMERCGVSKWHPDPVAACKAAESAKDQPAKVMRSHQPI